MNIVIKVYRDSDSEDHMVMASAPNFESAEMEMGKLQKYVDEKFKEEKEFADKTGIPF